MNHITIYTKILKVRTIFKRVQQLSWTVSKMEQRYELDDLDPADLERLLYAYKSFDDDLKNILKDLKDELNGDISG